MKTILQFAKETGLLRSKRIKPDKMLVVSNYALAGEHQVRLGPEWKVVSVGQAMGAPGPFKVIIFSAEKAYREAPERTRHWIERCLKHRLARDGVYIEAY